MNSFSKKQLNLFRKSNSWLNIAHGAVRSGKSVAYNYMWLNQCFQKKSGYGVIVGKTSRTVERNIIQPIKALIGNELRYNAGLGQAYVGNKLCYIYGANDERSADKIQGAGTGSALCDEMSLYPRSFLEMLLTRLSESGAQLFGTTNPGSPFSFLKTGVLDNEEYDLYQEHFRLDDNPFLPEHFVRNLKSSQSGLFYQRNIEGLWVLADGVVYDMFDENLHVSDNIPENISHKAVCIDYGITNPSVFLKLEWNTYDKVYVTDEYYYDYTDTNKQKTDTELADALEDFSKEKNIEHILDPSAASFFNELLKREHNIAKANNAVLDGIRFVSGLLKQNSVIIHPRCRNLIKEFGTYIWDAKAQLKGEDKPVKANDHCLDALRYGLYTKFGMGSALW